MLGRYFRGNALVMRALLVFVAIFSVVLFPVLGAPAESNLMAQKDLTGTLAMPCLLLAKYGDAATLHLGPVSLREIPPMPPLGKEWSLFLDVTAPGSFNSIPTELSGAKGVMKVQPVSLTDGALNLGQLAGSFKEKECAVLYNQFDSDKAGLVRVGVSADWWLELYANGEKVYSTLSDGNGSQAFAPGDHIVEFPVKAGRNILAAKVLSGSAGWRFVCGAPALGISEKSAAAKGSILKGTFAKSGIFPGTTRNYWVYVPAQYDSAKPACVYVSQDGHSSKFTDTMDILIESGEMPVTVGVFISPGTIPSPSESASSRSNRCYEYDSLGDDYVRFLLEEMLPFVAKEHNLNLSKDGNDRCIGGCSSGGICAFNAAWERPDAFRRVYSNSGSFVAFRGGDILPVLIRKYEAKPIRVFMHVATHDMENSGGNWWFANQEFERALAFSGYDYKYLWSEGGHGDKYADAFPEAMRWLWRDYPAVIPASKGPPRIQDILIPGEQWTLAGEGFQDAGSLAANSKGDVLLCDAAANRLYKIGHDGKAALFLSDAKQVCGLTAGPDGRIYGVSKATGRILVFEDDGKSGVVSEGVPGSALVATRDGGFYVTGQENGRSKIWHVGKNGEVNVVDAGLQNATGVAISSDGWLLHVADSASHWVYSYRIGADGSLSDKERFHWLHAPDNADDSGAEAICFDTTNHMFVATRIGIQTGDVSGHNQCVIPAPGGRVFGFCLGGPEFDVMYVSCGDKLFKRKVKVKGHYAFQPTVRPPAHGL